MDRLMMDCFSHTFGSFFFLSNTKSPKSENNNFLLVGFTIFPNSQVFLSGIKWVQT